MSNFNAINKNPIEHCITTAYWCRDQNFRKYFEIRKRHGLAPSVDVSKFYNKDKCKSYYDGLLQAKFMYDKVGNITK